jgi:hypothetical protein
MLFISFLSFTNFSPRLISVKQGIRYNAPQACPREGGGRGKERSKATQPFDLAQDRELVERQMMP